MKKHANNLIMVANGVGGAGTGLSQLHPGWDSQHPRVSPDSLNESGLTSGQERAGLH